MQAAPFSLIDSTAVRHALVLSFLSVFRPSLTVKGRICFFPPDHIYPIAKAGYEGVLVESHVALCPLREKYECRSRGPVASYKVWVARRTCG